MHDKEYYMKNRDRILKARKERRDYIKNRLLANLYEPECNLE